MLPANTCSHPANDGLHERGVWGAWSSACCLLSKQQGREQRSRLQAGREQLRVPGAPAGHTHPLHSPCLPSCPHDDHIAQSFHPSRILTVCYVTCDLIALFTLFFYGHKVRWRNRPPPWHGSSAVYTHCQRASCLAPCARPASLTVQPRPARGTQVWPNKKARMATGYVGFGTIMVLLPIVSERAAQVACDSSSMHPRRTLQPSACQVPAAHSLCK